VDVCSVLQGKITFALNASLSFMLMKNLKKINPSNFTNVIYRSGKCIEISNILVIEVLEKS